MKWFKPIVSIALQNMRKWSFDCRVWIAFIIPLILIRENTKQLAEICAYLGVKASPWIYPFLYMPYYNKLLFFFPLILIFSNAPFLDQNGLFVLIRSGRVKWCFAQLLYVAVTSVLYFLYILVFSVVLNLRSIEFTEDWGKLFHTLANTDLGNRFALGFEPERNVLSAFSPLLAVWFTFLHSVFCGVILGFAIFFFNMKHSGGGSFFASSLLVLSAVAAKQTVLLKLSPISWSTLNSIKLKPNDALPGYGYVMAVYIALMVMLFSAILFSSKRYEFVEKLKK